MQRSQPSQRGGFLNAEGDFRWKSNRNLRPRCFQAVWIWMTRVRARCVGAQVAGQESVVGSSANHVEGLGCLMILRDLVPSALVGSP